MKRIIDNIDNVSCIIGAQSIIFVVYGDLSIESFVTTLKDIEKLVIVYYFERVNCYTLINTKYIISIKGKRTVQLKNGMKFKVSRSKWELFKMYK